MGRPREFSDEHIYYGVYQSLCKKGFAQTTLADIAYEIGVSPAALIKRFSSKKGIFLAYTNYVIQLTEAKFNEADQSDAPPIEALKSVYKEAVRLGNDPVSLARHTSFYLESTTDPDLLEISRHRLAIIDAGTRRLLSKAVRDKSIQACDIELVSTVLQSAIGGALLIWIRDAGKTLDALIDDCFRVIIGPLRIGGNEHANDD